MRNPYINPINILQVLPTLLPNIFASLALFMPGNGNVLSRFCSRSVCPTVCHLKGVPCHV
jgi:hypothetical protein